MLTKAGMMMDVGIYYVKIWKIFTGLMHKLFLSSMVISDVYRSFIIDKNYIY